MDVGMPGSFNPGEPSIPLPSLNEVLGLQYDEKRFELFNDGIHFGSSLRCRRCGWEYFLGGNADAIFPAQAEAMHSICQA